MKEEKNSAKNPLGNFWTFATGCQPQSGLASYADSGYTAKQNVSM